MDTWTPLRISTAVRAVGRCDPAKGREPHSP